MRFTDNWLFYHSLGPILCGLIMNGGVGFDYVALGSGIACILYSPLLALLKYIDEEKEEKVNIANKFKRERIF